LPPFNQLIQDAFPEHGPSLNQVLLPLYGRLYSMLAVIVWG